MHLEHPGWARSRLALNGKIPKMAILGQKMVVFGHLRGLHGVKWRETLVCQRSTHFSHNIQNSAIYNEKWKNCGPKGFAMPYVNVPFFSLLIFQLDKCCTDKYHSETYPLIFIAKLSQVPASAGLSIALFPNYPATRPTRPDPTRPTRPDMNRSAHS